MDSDGIYKTKEMYKIITLGESFPEDFAFSWAKIWWKAIPLKVSAFTWKAIRIRISTQENLHIRGVLSPSASKICPCCGGAVETTNHLFVTCPTSLLV